MQASIVRSGASQPATPVIVLTGDFNLGKETCDSLVQKDKDEGSIQAQWQVLSSTAQLSGDMRFFEGAVGDGVDVTVGARNDQHDFFGVASEIPMYDL